MRGKKKLVLGIAVVSVTGMLVLTATFPQQQITKTEGTFYVTRNETGGIITELMPSETLAQAMSVEKKDAVILAVNVDEKQTADAESKASKEKNADVDSKASKEKTSDTKSKKSKENSSDAETENSKEKTSDTESEKSKENASDTETKDSKNKKTDTEKQSSDKKADKTEKENKKQSVEKKWPNKLMADVDDYLNIRESDNKDSKIVGKLRKGDVATIVKSGKAWTKIKSGTVTGYVKNKYCVFGTKAYKLANKICNTYVTVQADGLRIRKKANKNATILDAAEEGDKLLVNTKAKTKEGWIVVKCNDKDAYVSEKYVKVSLGTGEAISIEEELAQIAAQKKAEQAAVSAAQASSSSVSSSSTASAQVSSSDLTLLSAIIYCEAGGESYAGQVAVGAVVMNRVRSSSYPNSISGVVYQSGQFSPVANGALARALSNGNYKNCTSAAREALAGADNTGGAKFFHRVNGDAGLVIGNHVFY